MQKEKQIQISEKFFNQVHLLITLLKHGESIKLDKGMLDILNYLESEIDAKNDKILRHKAYTEYKLGQTPKEKEDARRKYISLSDIHKDWIR